MWEYLPALPPVVYFYRFYRAKFVIELPLPLNQFYQLIVQLPPQAHRLRESELLVLVPLVDGERNHVVALG